jgi:hypothetical protein
LIQAETATFIKQAETAYLIAVNLSPLRSWNWNVIDTAQKLKCTCNSQLHTYALRSSQVTSHAIIYAKMRELRVRVSTVSFSLTCIYFAMIGDSHI